jgi:beta-glucosidase
MTAYNRVNGTYCDMSKALLTDIAYGEWGWNGVFMSDWGGTNSCIQSINAGLSLEMPGPPAHRTEEKVISKAEKGNLNLKQLDLSVKRILQLLEKTGRFQDAPDAAEFCDDSPEKREALLKFASSGVVLLKNKDNTLPLDSKAGIKKLAILGPNSKRVVAGGGGSSYIKAPYWTNIYDSIKAKFDGTATEIVHHDGAKVNRYLPTMSNSVARSPLTGAPGGSIEWFSGRDLSSPAVATTAV